MKYLYQHTKQNWILLSAKSNVNLVSVNFHFSHDLPTFHVNVDQLWEDEGHSPGRGPGNLLKHDGYDGLIQQIGQA